MIYRGLADLTFILHFCFVLFVVFGGLLVLRRRAFLYLHVPALMWGVLVELLQLPCPLTDVENRLRALGGEAGYTGGFVEHYVSMILYASLSAQFQMTLGVLLVVFNWLVYRFVFRQTRRNHSPFYKHERNF